jgi:glycyl-tRNA synthetase
MRTLTEPRLFNLMFKTHMGPIEDEANEVYLRPETAQGIFVNFTNVLNSTRKKLPFGIAQIGKAFRNEITTGNFIFRTREFEIMEIEYFVTPGEDEESHRKWVDECLGWYKGLGIDTDRLRVRDHDPEELAHYSKATSDIEYSFPWGWGEIQGIANRTDFDLRAHTEKSGESLVYRDDSGQPVVPYVVEPAAGVDRTVMTFLVDAYTEEDAPTASGGTEKRVLLKLHPALSPVKVAILPLSRNERLAPLARDVSDRVRKSGAIQGLVQYDDAQSIGRRYRRQDEVGTPLCVTVDFDSLDDNAVTIRERDTMSQVRVPIESLVKELSRRLHA